jgi:hypothetical protein
MTSAGSDLQNRRPAADDLRMRLPILVYGVLYVVLEMVGHQLETVGWGRITPLHVASALVDALLAIVLAIAALVAFDLGRRRWGPALRAWQERQLESTEERLEPIGVASWRAGSEPFPPPRALGAAAVSTGGTYGTSTGGHRYPEDPGRLL